MNMVRIRHIMEMRRACKAPPLLPPKLRKEASESSDRRGVKDVLDINLRVQIVAPERFSSRFYYVQLYESPDGIEGPWNLITESDRLDIDETYDLEDIFAIEFSFERLQWVRLEICEQSDNNGKQFRGADIFNIGQVTAVNTMPLKILDQSGYRLAEIQVWSQIRERSQPIMMQLEAKNVAAKLSSNSNLFVEIYRVEDDLQKKLLYRSEPSKQSKLSWRPFTVQSTEVDADSDRQLEICIISDDEKEGIIGQAMITFDGAKTGDPIPIYHETYKQGRKPCGEVRVLRCQQLKVFSFLDYIKSGTSLRFGFAIDFSEREQLSREEHLQFANDVEFAVRCIGDNVVPFNPSGSFMSYGFGAKIPPQNRESNNFCLSLDCEAACQGVNGVLGSFMKCYQRVQPLPSAKFSQIIYHLAKNAQNSYNRDSSSSAYFVLFVITRGSVDDLKETVQAAIFSSKAPISIVFIGVGCDGLDEIERIGNAGRRLEYQGRKSERDNLQYVNATKTRLECDNFNEMSTTFLDKSLGQLPWQMASFFMQNHVPPGKSDENILMGRRQSSTSSLSQGSQSVETLGGSSFEESEDSNYDQRAVMRASSGDVVTKSRRKGLTSNMRSLTIDDSSSNF